MTEPTTTTTLICPKCGGQMRNYERSGVIVDQCTDCRGIFLDRGELERLIDAEDIHYGGSSGRRPEQAAPVAGAEGGYGAVRDVDQGQAQDRGSGGHGSSDGGQRKRRGGFLGDLLDFGD